MPRFGPGGIGPGPRAGTVEAVPEEVVGDTDDDTAAIAATGAAGADGLCDAPASGGSAVVSSVVAGWHRLGRPVDLVLDGAGRPDDPEPAPREPPERPSRTEPPASTAFVPPPERAAVPRVRRSLGGTPSPWARSPGLDARTAGDAPPVVSPSEAPELDRPDPVVDESVSDDGAGVPLADAPVAVSGSDRTGESAAVGPDDASVAAAPKGSVESALSRVPSTALAVTSPDGATGDPGGADGPLVARDPTALGPSLPRRAGSLVRRWITRVVSFVKRLPRRLGFGGRRDDAREDDGQD